MQLRRRIAELEHFADDGHSAASYRVSPAIIASARDRAVGFELYESSTIVSRLRPGDFSAPGDGLQRRGALDDVDERHIEADRHRRRRQNVGEIRRTRQRCPHLRLADRRPHQGRRAVDADDRVPPAHEHPPAARRRRFGRDRRISPRDASPGHRRRWPRAARRCRRPRESSAFASAIASTVPKNSRWAGPTLVHTRTSGSAILTSALISPKWFMPSSKTPMSGFVLSSRSDSGKPDVIVQVPLVAKDPVPRRQKLGRDLLRRRLSRAARHRHDAGSRFASHAVWPAPAAPRRCRARRSAASMPVPAMSSSAASLTIAATAPLRDRLRHVSVAVEPLATNRDEQVARRNRPRVDREAAMISRSLPQPGHSLRPSAAGDRCAASASPLQRLARDLRFVERQLATADRSGTSRVPSRRAARDRPARAFLIAN